MLDTILITLGIIGLLIATISDIKTREIPDWLSYSLIITGIAIRLLNSLIYKEFLSLAYTALAFAIVFSFATILYHTRQWGGGDAKILMALSVIFAIKPAYLPETNIPFLFILITNILFIGAIYGLTWGIILAIKKRNRFKQELIHLLNKKTIKTVSKYTLTITLIWFIFIFISKTPAMKLIFIFLTILPPTYFILWLGTKTIERIGMYKRRTVDHLKLGDWLAEDIIKDGELIIKRKPEGLTNFDIKRLKNNRIKTIIIKEGIPFIPPFLIATILTLINNKFLFLIP